MFLVEMFQRKTTMPDAAEALAGRAEPIETAATHAVNGRSLKPPFADGLETLAEAGVTAIVEPGGSMRDDEVIQAANAAGIALVFTGQRHFLH